MDSIKKRWIAALRSGQYEQGTMWLHLNGKHCSLGVLEVLYCKEKGIASPVGHVNILLPEVVRWSGIPFYEMHPEVAGKGVIDLEDWFIEMNDRKRLSFEEIADWIERNL